MRDQDDFQPHGIKVLFIIMWAFYRIHFLQAPQKIFIMKNSYAKLKASAKCSSGTCGSPRKDKGIFKAYFLT
jgi:hypothetical protein